MSLQHTEINHPGYFTFCLLPCEETWDEEVQALVEYNETPDESNYVQAEAWVHAPNAPLKAHMLTVRVPAAPDRAQMENDVIAKLVSDDEFTQNMLDYLSVVVEKDNGMEL